LDLDPEGDVLSLADNPLLVSEESAVAETPPAEEAPALVENLPDNAVAENVAVAAPPAPVNRLVAENIGLDTSIVEVRWNTVMQEGIQVNVWTVADYAAGWHQNSNLPGQGGNIVLSGHHNIKGEVFRYIVDLEIGDTLTLYMGDQAFNYKVQDKFIVKDKGEPQEVRIANARWIGPFDDERLTLVTCWPYTDNTHRVIVIAKPVP
jgi:sortase A